MRRAFSWAAAVATALACVGCSTATASSPVARPGNLHVLLLNGGGTAEENYASHLAHLRQMVSLVRQAGVPAERLHVFASDGAHPAPDLAVRDVSPDGSWLLGGTEAGRRLSPPLRLVSSQVPGVVLRPATRQSLERGFARLRAELRAGDTLLLYVTDHGTGHPRDPLENRITLWGPRESLSVRQLKTLLLGLPAGVRVVALMSQCFSGGFARLYQARPEVGGVCGYFSSTADRPAYGCYPEVAGLERIGHSFAFMEALARTGNFSQAHLEVLASDTTPDVPLRTSDVFLEDLLARASRGRAPRTEETPGARGRDALVDGLLGEAWKDRSTWEPDLRRLDRLSRAFGMWSPRSLSELERHAARLTEVLEQVERHGEDWEQASIFARQANLRRFLETDPAWAAQLAPRALAALPPARREKLIASVLIELENFLGRDPLRQQRLGVLAQKSHAADQAAYRMDVRLAVVLRLRTLLTEIAGRRYLATRATAADRAAFEALRRCEALDWPLPPPAPAASPAPEPYPSLQDDLRLVKEVLPGWMGIVFDPLSPARRRSLGLHEGPALVRQTLPGSPAARAGLVPGDIVLGPPDRPFTENGEIKAWTMLLPIGRPQPVEILRAGARRRITLIPGERPVELPALGGPPPLSQAAPAVMGTPYRGAPPPLIAAKGPFLLFFWATWCVPCKEALPEVMAFARQRQMPVVAVTDEDRPTLDAFFARFRASFPEHVLSDEDRLTFQAYGVSGTPTFVLIDGDRKVQSYATGYSRARGLPVDGWRWDGR